MKLHHLGFVVKDIERFERNLIHDGKIKECIDPTQNAKLSLFRGYSNVFIELIQPLNEKSFTWNFSLKSKNPFHHFCYEVESNKEMETLVNDKNLIRLLGPIPAILFEGKNVFFFYDRNKIIVEFLITPK